MSCSLMELAQSRLDWILNTCLIKALKRIFPLGNASWMIADIALDVNQTITYYYLIDGFNEGGEYHDWALKYKEETKKLSLEEVADEFVAKNERRRTDFGVRK